MCDGPCDFMQYIWKNEGGKRFCKRCWSAQTKVTNTKPTVLRKKIPPRSSKKMKEDIEYSKKRKSFLLAHPMCEARISNCTGNSSEVHHTYVGSNRSKYFLVEETWIAICRNCHNWIHEHSKEARAINLLK